jgi:hypothetical protein
MMDCEIKKLNQRKREKPSIPKVIPSKIGMVPPII